MPRSMDRVFFCASDSSTLCLAAFCIFCCAIFCCAATYTCCWLFGLPEKKLPIRLASPCSLPRPVSSSGPGVTALSPLHF